MEFIQVILQNSNLKEAKLYGAAQKAATNPEIGITIQNKAAYHVIKDCAAISMIYLPHMVFGSYVNPFESLSGKFKREAIAEFIKVAETNLSLNQLLDIILAKAEKMNIIPSSQSTTISHGFEQMDNPSDPYGNYGFDSPATKIVPVSTALTPFDILCKVFSVL